jgi:hypothetical protein
VLPEGPNRNPALAESPHPDDAEIYWRTAPLNAVESRDALHAIEQLVAHERAWSAWPSPRSRYSSAAKPPQKPRANQRLN